MSPVDSDGSREPEQTVGIALVRVPGECGTQVGVVGVQPVEHLPAGGKKPCRPVSLGERQEERRVAVPDLIFFPALRQPLQPKLADRFEQQKPRFARGRVDRLEQTLTGEAGEAVEDRVGGSVSGRSSDLRPPTSDHVRGLQREAVLENGEAAKEDLLAGGEEVVAPGDGITHRAQPGWLVPWSVAQQRHPGIQPGQHLRWRNERDPRRRQLDGQRQAVEAAADGGHGLRVFRGEGEVGPGRRGAGDEQPHRLGPRHLGERHFLATVGQRQGRQGVPVLAGHPQGSAARDQRRQCRAGGQQTGDEGPGVQHLLEIVEHQERPPLAQKTRQVLLDRAVLALSNAKRLRDARGDERRIADGGKGNEPDAVGEVGSGFFGSCEGQAGFADAARAGEGQQTHLLLQQKVLHCGDFVVATDERAAGQKQVAAERLGGAPLARVPVDATIRFIRVVPVEIQVSVCCIWGGASTARVGRGHGSP
jgi:hypothetical protein